MTRSVLALFQADKAEPLSFRDLVIRRLLQAVLLCMVALTSFLAGTIISAIFLRGIEL